MKAKLASGTVAVVALIGSGAASAAIPSADDSFDACVNHATGVMRVIDEAKSGNLGNCISTGPGVLRETAISWNQTGPNGPQGLQGIQACQDPLGRRVPPVGTAPTPQCRTRSSSPPTSPRRWPPQRAT